MSDTVNHIGEYGWGLWLIILGMAAVTILNRAGFILLSGKLSLPPKVQRALKYAPAAALSAIAMPDLFIAHGQIDISLDNVRLIAGLFGFTIAVLARSTLPAIIGGMLALHALERLL
ncbi:MAG TPA: AzlD domain-containing protein [Burkholderiales bacterium]|jgi:branched-subunit amino acid transport protein